MRKRIFIFPIESVEVTADGEDGSILKEEDPVHRVDRLVADRVEREARPFHGEELLTRLVCDRRKSAPSPSRGEGRKECGVGECGLEEC